VSLIGVVAAQTKRWKAGNNSQEYLEIKFTEVRITSV